MEKSPKTILFPWLLFSHGKDYTNKTLCNIASSTHQSSPIRALKNKTVLGSSYGWLILKNKSTHKTTADFYSLWNPITLKSIDLPPFTSEPEYIIRSFILSSPPSVDDPNSMLLLFEAGIPAIFFCRISNPKWVGIRYDNSSDQIRMELSYGKVDIDHLHSPVSYNGNIFATTRRRNLFRVEINLDNTAILQPVIDLPAVPTPYSLYQCDNLVECCGELYTVYYTVDDAFGLAGIHDDIVAVHVFKLNFSQMIWNKVDNIDNHAFFVKKNIAISSPAAALSNFPTQSNRIYFIMEDVDDKSLFSYHVEDGTLTMSRPCPDLPPPLTSPTWVPLPTLGTKKGEQKEETLKALVFTEERKDNEKNVFPLTDLLVDLQHLIVKKLLPFDYMNFRATCRMNCIIASPINWRTKLAGSDQSDQLHSLSPCLIYSPIGKNVCNILDPNFSGRYLVKTPDFFQDPIVRCCKEGWLLMSESEYSKDLLLSMFLFNPFTKATIQLPYMGLEYKDALRFSLTSLPDSSDHCYVVCFLNWCKKANFLVTSPGSEHWTYLELNNTKDFYPIDSVPVFLNNSFYYLSEKEELGVLKITDEGWSWDVWDVQGKPKDFQHNYLVECNGSLLCVFVGHCGKWVKVFKLCECKNNTLLRWEPVLDLGKHILYLSRLSTVCKVAQVEGTENRIYFERLYKEKAIFYSLGSQKFHTSDGKDSLTSYYNTCEVLLSAWIQPNWCEYK